MCAIVPVKGGEYAGRSGHDWLSLRFISPGCTISITILHSCWSLVLLIRVLVISYGDGLGMKDSIGGLVVGGILLCVGIC